MEHNHIHLQTVRSYYHFFNAKNFQFYNQLDTGAISNKKFLHKRTTMSLHTKASNFALKSILDTKHDRN